MTISLKPETERLLEERLKAGGYQSADEVVGAALMALGSPATVAIRLIKGIRISHGNS